MKDLKTFITTPLITKGTRYVPAFITSEIKQPGKYGGVTWSVDSHLHFILPRCSIVTHGLTMHSESDNCFVCSQRIKCIASTARERDECHTRNSEVKIIGNSLELDRFLLTSLFDDYKVLRLFRDWKISDFLEHKEMLRKFLRAAEYEISPRECNKCFLLLFCPQNYRLRALNKKCSHMNFDWVKERLEGGNVAIRYTGDDIEYIDRQLYFVWGRWDIITHLVFRPVWIARDKDSVLGNRLMHDSFLKESIRTQKPSTFTEQYVKIASECFFKVIHDDDDFLFALRKLARQARLLCVISPECVGNIGPYTTGTLGPDILREVSFYWPIIKLALEHRCDVWDLCHLY